MGVYDVSNPRNPFRDISPTSLLEGEVLSESCLRRGEGEMDVEGDMEERWMLKER
jgi:hypothetical protein